MRIRLNHNQLMNEVFGQVQKRFQPQVALIKKQVETLMEKEFIERVENNEYQYIA